jgi:hypothetical protein
MTERFVAYSLVFRNKQPRHGACKQSPVQLQHTRGERRSLCGFCAKSAQGASQRLATKLAQGYGRTGSAAQRTNRIRDTQGAGLVKA